MAGKQNTQVRYAPKIDIFGDMVKSLHQNAGQFERSGIRDIQQGQFDQGMNLKKDVFSETQKQNAFRQGIANQRLGLAKQANARAAAAAANAMTPAEKLKAQMAFAAHQNSLGYDKNGKPFYNPNAYKGGTGKGGLTPAQREGLSLEQSAQYDTDYNTIKANNTEGWSNAQINEHLQKGYKADAPFYDIFSGDSSFRTPGN